MNSTWDAAGLCVSAACAVHCLALPVAAATLPALAFFAEAEWLHWAFVALAAPISLFALSFSARRRRPPLFAIALALLGVGMLVFGALEIPSHEAGVVVTMFGATALAGSHIANWRSRHGALH